MHKKSKSGIFEPLKNDSALEISQRYALDSVLLNGSNSRSPSKFKGSLLKTPSPTTNLKVSQMVQESSSFNQPFTASI